jgi:hypothetical protein
MQRTRGGIQRVSQHQLGASDDRRTCRLPSQAHLTKRLLMDGTGALNSNGRSEPDGAVPVFLPVALTIDPVGDGWRVTCRRCAHEPACVTVVTDETLGMG